MIGLYTIAGKRELGLGSIRACKGHFVEMVGIDGVLTIRYRSDVVYIGIVMKILLIEAGYIDKDWLQAYFGEYDPSISVISSKSFAEAGKVLKNGEKPDVILIDGRVPDALAPTAVSEIVYNASLTPIVFLETGKTLHYECTRVPQTNIYHLKTDVTKVTFLNHLRTIVNEVHGEMVEHA